MKEIIVNVDNYNENSIKTTEGDNLSEVYKIYICKNKRRVNLTNKIAIMAYVNEYGNKKSNILALNITNASQGEIELPITNVISSENGVYACQIAIYGENNSLEQTAPFSLIVENNIFSKISNTAINSSDFHILSEAIKTANEYSEKLKQGTENIELQYADKLNLFNSQLSEIAQQRLNVISLGLHPDTGEDVTEKLQELINSYKNLYFPAGKYIISRPIQLRSDIDLYFEKESIIFLKDMSKCIMFDTIAKIKYKNIKIKGGVFDGNDYGQGEQPSVGLFNFSNAFRFYNVEHLRVSDLTLKNIRGHSIQHWNCNDVIFENIEFRQSVDMVTKPNGGSRRDGITGGSSNVVYRNLRGFTDDDMIAILSGVAWGGVQVENVENILIQNVICEDREIQKGTNHNTWCGVRIACANGYKTKNVVIDGLKGKFANYFVRLGGYDDYKGGFLENITIRNGIIEALNMPSMYDEKGDIFVEQCIVNSLTIDNVVSRTETEFKGCFLFLKNASVENLKMTNVDYYHNNTGTVMSETTFIKDYWSDSTFKNCYIKNLLLNNVKYNSTKNKMLLYRKQKTLPDEITKITKISGENILGSTVENMVGGEYDFISVNSRNIQINPILLKNQDVGSVFKYKGSIVTTTENKGFSFSHLDCIVTNDFISFKPYNGTILVNASGTSYIRIQDDENFIFPVGYTIKIKRLDNNSSNKNPYIKFSNEKNIQGLTQAGNTLQLDIGASYSLTHIGAGDWVLVNS